MSESALSGWKNTWWYLKSLLILTVLTALFSRCFYDGWLLFFMYPLILFFGIRFLRKRENQIEKKRMGEQFLDFCQALAGGLRTGYALGKAVRLSIEEVKKIWGEDNRFCSYFDSFSKTEKWNISDTDKLIQIAEELNMEDFLLLAQMLSDGEKMGGNLALMAEETADQMAVLLRVRAETEAEAANSILQARIMEWILPLILMYLQFTMPDLLEPLYSDLTGRIFMTVCLGVYAACVFRMERLIANAA